MNGWFYKKNKDDKIWWYREKNFFGDPCFSFDKKKIYHIYADYPDNLTDEEIKIFNSENQDWLDFLNGIADEEEPSAKVQDYGRKQLY